MLLMHKVNNFVVVVRCTKACTRLDQCRVVVTLNCLESCLQIITSGGPEPHQLGIGSSKLGEKRVFIPGEFLNNGQAHRIVRKHTVCWDADHRAHLHGRVIPRPLQQCAVVGRIKRQRITKTLAAQLR